MENPASFSTSRDDEKDDGNVHLGNGRDVRDEAADKYTETRNKLKKKIVSLKNTRKFRPNNNNITVVRSNKLLHALDLPIAVNLNPTSVYNKINEFHALVKKEEADVIFMSESWEREKH